MNSWDRFRREDRRKRRLFLEPLERRDLMAIAEFTALPDQHYQAAPNIESFLTAPQSGAPATLAINYLRNNASSFGLAAADLNHYEVTNSYTSQVGGISHVYLRQTYNGLPIANALANVSMMSDGRVLTASASFVPGLVPPPANSPPNPFISAVQALRNVASAHGLPVAIPATTTVPASGRSMKTVFSAPQMSRSPIVAELQYVPKSTGGVQLAWRINADMIEGFNWYDASVNAEYSPMGPMGQIINVSDWVDNATYNVFPIPVESPLHGGRSFDTDPQDPTFSPFGWHDTNGAAGAEFTVTRGNNVSAQEDADNNDTGGVQPDGGAGLNFDFPLDLTQGAASYTDAATVNLFYWNNIVHDITAQHGFDEVSGNFQQTNYTGQGLGGDQVQADAQDGSGTNNANFSTPPDGQSGRMQQYIFDITNPTRDSSLDSSIIVHEFGHGVSNRLTGGPANSNALNALQSGGMGEGWSDWLGLMLTQKPGDQANDARGLGMWVLGQPITGVGIRRAPYSFDMAINPRTLGDFNQSNEVHDAGEAWSSALWDMNWLLINRHGYDPNLLTGGGGNNLALDIVLLAMKLQPANPTFCEARDAVLAADAALTGSDNFVEIWTAFARRGFGLSANCGANADSTVVVEAFDQPAPPVKLGGTVFIDENGNRVRDAGEGPLDGWTIYLDANNNATRDSGERFQVSAANGTYLFSLFNSGNLVVREELQPFYRQTFPTGDGAHRITINPGQSALNLHFGNQPLPGEIHGRKWNDIDADAVLDAGEPGIQGVVIYVDLNNDSKIGIGEPAAVTNSSGNYTIVNLRPGAYTVREVYQPGFLQTFPDPAAPTFGAHSPVIVTTGTITPNINFGNQAAFDYGDARTPSGPTYPTLISQNGAVHGLLQGFYLGAKVDSEPNGQPTVGADGDDFAGNESQTVRIGSTTTAGTFRLTFAGQTTAPIAFNANATAVRNALQALTNIGTGQVAVTGGPGPANAWTVTFQGTLAGKNLAPLIGSGTLLVPSGNVTIATQLNGGSDDEDGIILGNLVPGQTSTITVTASTGAFAAGYLQGWIDFNRDGDWDDSGEKIFTDRALTTGTVSLSFPVPASADLGPTYARFRYSLEHGIGPRGTALGGEVEDYRTNLLGIAPTAIDDPSIPGDPLFVVDDNPFGTNNPAPLNVLLNDLPSSTGPAGIDPASAPTTSDQGGTVFLNTNGTPADLTDDFFEYTAPVGFVGVDKFRYHAVDPQGHVSNEAEVSVTVRFVLRDPIAIDDTFDVLVNSPATANKLDVMANDVPGAGGALRLQNQTNFATPHGQVTFANNGTAGNFSDDFYSYTPNPGYSGGDSFTYTITDSSGDTSTATVTLQVVPAPRTAPSVPPTEADIMFELEVRRSDGTLIDPLIGTITVGESVFVRGLITDLRPPSETIDSSLIPPIDFAGAYSAYMDLLYDRARFQPTGDLIISPAYNTARSGIGGTPGLIDEVGGTFSNQANPPGHGKKLVFIKEFVATATGLNVQFKANPADSPPPGAPSAHDINAFVIDPDPLLSKPQPIPTAKVYYLAAPPIVEIIPMGAGEDTNLRAPVDVNLDGKVSPIDALLVINYLNKNGIPDPAGSGEETPDGWKRDVNHDDLISPIDALLVINHLNRHLSASVAGEGEAEGEADFASPLSPVAVSVTGQTTGKSADSTSGGDAGAAAATLYAAAVDQVFGEPDSTRTKVIRNEITPYSTPVSETDEFFTTLGSGTSRRARKSR